MARTQNGWLHLSTAKLQAKYLTTISIPGTDPLRRFRVRKGNVAKVFAWLAREFDTKVESLNEGHPNDDWSYADRPVRGGSSTSNHASGTAVDFNATQHPLGTSPAANFTSKQRLATRRILRATVVDGVQVIRWGGDYSGRKDPMHFEINADADRVARLAGRIKAPAPVTPPEEEPDVKMDYYGVRPVSLKAVGGHDKPQYLQFARGETASDKWWLGVVSAGDKSQVCHVTLELVFDNDDLTLGEVVKGRVIWTVHNKDGSEHADYGSSPLELSKWADDDPLSLPGRVTLVHQSGRVYGPDRYLRAAVELSKAVALQAGEARVSLFTEKG